MRMARAQRAYWTAVPDGIDLRDHLCGVREVAAERGHLTACVVRGGEDLERPGVARERNRTHADLQAAVVVPEDVGRARRQPAPAQHFLHRDFGTRERGESALEHRRCGWTPLGEDQRIGASAPQLAAELKTDKQFVRFSSADGAGDHCEQDAGTLFHARAFGWLDGVLEPARIA